MKTSSTSTRSTSQPFFIHGDDGHWLLADTEEQAREFAAADDPQMVLTEDGWMCDVGWDRDCYERKRDFVHDTGFKSWWVYCQPPAGGQPSKNCKRAFRVSYSPARGQKEAPDASC